MAYALELLAPAGAFEQLTAAVQNGADAVYLGGRAFSARRFAGNFENDELQRAFDYCHLRGVHAYVTFNTLLLDRELPSALDYAAFLYEAGADALIVQDLGLTRMLRTQLSEIALHASTQMGIHDENGLTMCAELGFSRAVLARELSLSRVRELCAHSPVPIECFAHGALCTAMSGACLFSSLAGGRSGNRGACAQPCRKPYTAEGAGEVYPLSLEDLCMLFHVGELYGAGVMSIKLEGRMKRPEYVAAMVRAYRMAIDGASENELEQALLDMQRIFSRGCSTGYYYGADVPAGARGILSGEDAPLLKMRETYRGEQRRRNVQAKLTLHAGKPAELALALDDVCAAVQGETVQPAQKPPNQARYISQIGKLGDTPFALEHCALDMPAPAYLPVSALNALRRDAVQVLSDMLFVRREKVMPVLPLLPPPRGNAAPKVLAIVPDVDRARAAYGAGSDEVAIEPRCPDMAHEALEALQGFRAQGKRLFLQLPAADFSGRAQHVWRELMQSGLADGGVAQNAGQVQMIEGIRIAGYLCNATNAQAAAQLFALGFDRVLLSLELTRPQLRDLITLGGVGVYAYGRAQLMQLWHCPYRRAGGCRDCGATEKPHALVDEAGRVFPLDPVTGHPVTGHPVTGRPESGLGGCLTRVRNCEVMDILDVLHELPAPACAALEFVFETEEEVAERVHAARTALFGGSPPRRGSTRGHWARGLDS